MRRTALLALTLLAICFTWSTAAAEEPSVRVETYPQWTAGDLAIYLLDFPGDGVTYSSDTISIRVAVWGATENNPIIILLDGEEAARIEGPGMYIYEWSLRGSHHLLIRCETMIFQQAAFNVKAPPPPPPTIQLDEFYRRLEEQRNTMMLAMVAATVVGVPTGVWFKKKTKITTTWAAVPMGVVMLIGIRWLPDLYMLIPYSLSAAMVYWLARGYATMKAVAEYHEGGLERINTYPFDDTGRGIIADVSPRHWRTGFIHVKPVEIEGKEGYSSLEINGEHFPKITVKGDGYRETEDRITVKSEWSLAQALAEAEIISRLTTEVSTSRIARMYMERALPIVVTRIMQEYETNLRESMLDRVLDVGDVRRHVDEATKKLSAELLKMIPQPPGEEPPEEEENAEG